MKKTLAILLAALLALGFAACAKTTETKSANQITIFAAAELENALTEIAQWYTDVEKNPNAKKDAVVLFDCGETDALAAKLADGAYCDVFIPAGMEALGSRDLAGPSAFSIKGTASDGSEVSYPAAQLNMSDRQDAAGAFLDYLKGDDAKAIFEKHGFTVNP